LIRTVRRPGKLVSAAACSLLALLPACDGSVTDPADYQLTIVEGDAQVGEARSQLAAPLVVLVSAAGRPAAGVEVAWRAEEADGVVAPTTLTDAAGYARADRTLGPQAGQHGTVASVGSAAARFTSIAQVQGAVHMHMDPTAGGNGQVDTVQAMLQPLRVLVTDHHGAPVEGVQVYWSMGRPESVTDANGIAALTHQLGPVAGGILITAEVSGLIGSPVSFVAIARAGQPVDFVKVGGDEQMALVGGLLAPVYAMVRDAHGNPVGGVSLSWSAAGGGVIETAHHVTPEYVSASATRRLGPGEGEYTTTVSTDVASLPTLTFTATAVTTIVVVSRFNDYWCYYYGSEHCAAFTPLETFITAGRTVGWRWDGSFACDLVFEDAPEPPTSSGVRLHGTHTRTFHEPGIYLYRCTTSSPVSPVGRVVVQ
jgi:plastocyanin